MRLMFEITVIWNAIWTKLRFDLINKLENKSLSLFP